MKFALLLLAGFLGSACLPYLYTPEDTQEIRTRSGGKQREYLLHVPPTYSKDKPVPLVVTIHGLAQWPAHQLWLSRWNRVADEHGFLVAYPSGTGLPKRWTMGGSNHAQFHPEEDVAFLRRMLAEIQRDYRIDPARIYVNGLSNGGGMTYVLACELAGQVAAAGFVSPGLIEPKGGCKPARPMPVIAFHGTEDGIVPYQGGSLVIAPHPFPSISDWIAAWGVRNRCESSPALARVTPSVRLTRYANCGEGAEVLLYTVEGGGHTWPGGEELPVFIAGHTTQEIDATRLMWAFFEAHPKVRKVR